MQTPILNVNLMVADMLQHAARVLREENKRVKGCDKCRNVPHTTNYCSYCGKRLEKLHDEDESEGTL